LTTLSRCDADRPLPLAFLAMTRHQLGDRERARTTLDRLRDIMNEPAWAGNADAAAALREAARLIEGGPGQPRPLPPPLATSVPGGGTIGGARALPSWRISPGPPRQSLQGGLRLPRQPRLGCPLRQPFQELAGLRRTDPLQDADRAQVPAVLRRLNQPQAGQ